MQRSGTLGVKPRQAKPRKGRRKTSACCCRRLCGIRCTPACFEQVAGGTIARSIYAFESENVKQKAINKLEQMLLEGLASGDPIPATPEFWKKMRQDLIELHQKRVHDHSDS